MNRAKHLFLFILIKMLLITAAASASESLEPYSYEKFQTITPLDATTQMLSGDTQVSNDIVIGSEYVLFGTIGKVSANGIRVHAEGANMFAIIGIMDFQFGYTRQEYYVTSRKPNGDTKFTHSADVAQIKWVSNSRIIHMPCNGRIALGSIFYFGKSRGNELDFAQPYASLSFEYGRARAAIGANLITGELPDEAGVFASLQYAVSPELIWYVDYSEQDFHKTIINRIIVPGAGIDCSGCSEDAVSIGLVVKAGNYGYANFGMYDVDDLASPMGSLSFRKNY